MSIDITKKLIEKKKSLELEEKDRKKARLKMIDEELTETNENIRNLKTAAVVNFVSDISVKAKLYRKNKEKKDLLEKEILEKKSYKSSFSKILVVEISLAFLLATVIGKIALEDSSLIEKLTFLSFFQLMDFKGGIGVFLDFIIQEFVTIFLLSFAIKAALRKTDIIHDKNILLQVGGYLIISLLFVFAISLKGGSTNGLF